MNITIFRQGRPKSACPALFFGTGKSRQFSSYVHYGVRHVERKESFLEKAAQTLDLPADVTGLPRLELVGDRELRVEYHKGILSYGTDEIHISAGRMVIRVTGRGLELRSMNAAELLITGAVQMVELM